LCAHTGAHPRNRDGDRPEGGAIVNQRWKDRRASYRPAAEPIRTRLYEVASIPGDTQARAFVEQHHYSGSYPAARFRFGLYRGSALQGVAVFSVPMRSEVITKGIGCAFDEGTELGRLVLLDEVPGNGESWFVARCFELLRRDGIAGVVSHSDPTPRETVAGQLVLPGHVGFVYQALNAVYLGRTRRRTLKLLPDGRCLNERAEAKIRAADSRWRSAARPLIDAGAPEPTHVSSEGLRAWASVWIPRLTRPLPHPGNHRYVWAFHRALRKSLPSALPYPKSIDLRRAA
jgi:hypothetical protein